MASPGHSLGAGLEEARMKRNATGRGRADQTDEDVAATQRANGEFLRVCDRFFCAQRAVVKPQRPADNENRRIARASDLLLAMIDDVFGGGIHPSTLACALTQMLGFLAGMVDVECVEADSATRGFVSGMDLLDEFSRHMRASYEDGMKVTKDRVPQN
jgi:hypothetical protein